MTKYLYKLMEYIAIIHNYILTLNDSNETSFTDKELHFLVIGIMGLMLVCLIQPVFKFLAKNNHILTITWIYVFTLIIVITFAIEIGQKITGTGVMEFADIMFGVVGFLIIFLIYPIGRGIIRGIVRLVHWISKR